LLESKNRTYLWNMELKCWLKCFVSRRMFYAFFSQQGSRGACRIYKTTRWILMKL
jgi:hypothetical protein